MSADNRRSVLYLVAELLRLLGRFEESVAAFDRFLDEPVEDEGWRRAAEALRARAQAGNASVCSMQGLTGA